MPISVICQQCGKKLVADERLAGRGAACPACNNNVRIPAAADGSSARSTATTEQEDSYAIKDDPVPPKKEPPAPTATDVNPYHLMLGLPPSVTAPNIYQLLGLELFEQETSTIRRASSDRNRMLMNWQNPSNMAHYKLADRLMTEVAEARDLLLDPEERKTYDDVLRQQVAMPQEAPPERPTQVPSKRGAAPPSQDSDAAFTAPAAKSPRRLAKAQRLSPQPLPASPRAPSTESAPGIPGVAADEFAEQLSHWKRRLPEVESVLRPDVSLSWHSIRLILKPVALFWITLSSGALYCVAAMPFAVIMGKAAESGSRVGASMAGLIMLGLLGWGMHLVAMGIADAIGEVADAAIRGRLWARMLACTEVIAVTVLAGLVAQFIMPQIVPFLGGQAVFWGFVIAGLYSVVHINLRTQRPFCTQCDKWLTTTHFGRVTTANAGEFVDAARRRAYEVARAVLDRPAEEDDSVVVSTQLIQCPGCAKAFLEATVSFRRRVSWLVLSSRMTAAQVNVLLRTTDNDENRSGN